MPAHRITEVGFENIEAIFFRTTIEMASNYDISEWDLVEGQDVDVILVNADIEECTSELISDSTMQNNTRPILIGCSSSGKEYDFFSYTLKKPITYSMIVNLLLKLEVELAVTLQTSAPLTDKLEETSKEQHSNSPLQKQAHSEGLIEPETYALSTSPIEDYQDQIDNHIDIDNEIIRFIEERRFLGILRKSVALGYPTEILHHIYPPVRIYPDKQIFAQKSNFWLSPDLFTTESSGFSIQKLTKHRENVPVSDWNIRPLWQLFYLAALYGSEGRLKENDSPDDRLSLISKPDFDIVPNQLDYWKVSDYMINKKPQDINEIADGSGVNIKTVIDFCNACEEIDIIERTTSTHSETRST